MPLIPREIPYSNWCFTVNNWTALDKEQVLALPYTYLLFGEEVGDLGTPHLQGYVQLKTRTRRDTLSKLVPRARLENALGSLAENDTYCKKDGLYTELGTPKASKGKPSKATILERNKRLLDTSISLDDLVAAEELTPYNVTCIRNARLAIQLDNNMRNPAPDLDRNHPLTHEWFWGETRTGKTTAARENNPGFYLKSKDRWWDHYNGEEVVIIEDLDLNHVHLLGPIKEYADYWQFKAEVKGGQLGCIRPKKIVVTSNYHPTELWSNPKEHEPILSRFRIQEFTRIDKKQKTGIQPSTSYATGGASRFPTFDYGSLQPQE